MFNPHIHSKSLDDIGASLDRRMTSLSKFPNIQETEIIDISPQELAAADYNRARPLSPDDVNPELTNLLNNNLSRYNEKYGTNLSFDDLQDYLKFSIEGSTEEREVKKLITKDLIYNALEFGIQKSILVFVNQLNRLLNNLQRESLNQDIGPTLLVTMDQLMQYIFKLDELRNKYKVYDLDSSITNVRKISGSDTSIDYSTVKDAIGMLQKNQ